MALVLREIRVASILNRSAISGIDYAINPYTGCLHGCVYCYADFMRRFTGHSEPWGDFVDVKINCPELLEKQVLKAKPGEISFSTVTDPYQPVERKYRLTRRSLEILLNTPFTVSILTKSVLVLRDIDLLKKMKNSTVGFSIPIFSEKISALFEGRASPPSERFQALRKLRQEGISTWLFIAPSLPSFSDSEENLEQLFNQARDSGVEYVLIDTFQAYPRVWHKVKALLQEKFPHLVPLYEEYREFKDEFKESLRMKASELGRILGVEVRFAF
ncbi:MAG: SPL family radical SAM protein [bacterium]|jgi:DNA repair photolyase|nr:radical SAM protein [Caldisericota bacterium]